MDYQGSAGTLSSQQQNTKITDLQHAEFTKRGPGRTNSRRNSVAPTTSQYNIDHDEINKLMHDLKYPCNESGTFLHNFTVKCPFCFKKPFDRPDELKLHYGQQHASLYGTLSDQVIDKQYKTNSESEDNAVPIKKRRRSVYINENELNSDSGEENENPDDIATNPNANNILPASITSESNETQKENSTESLQTVDFNGYRSDVAIQSILTYANEIHSFLAIANERNIKLSEKISELLNYKKIKKRKRQKTISLIYKCEQCSTHFLKRSKWVKHLQRRDHTCSTFNCIDCGLKFSKKSKVKHMKMHENKRFTDFNVTTELMSSSDTEASENSDDTMYDPNSAGSSKGTPHVPSTSEKAKDAITKNDNTDSENPQRDGSKIVKVKLYQCDDCEVNFFDMKYLRSHLKSSTHHITERKYTCDIENCQLKFKNNFWLELHRNEHHNNVLNLSKDDFKFIRWKGQRLPTIKKCNDTKSRRPFQHPKETFQKTSNKKKHSDKIQKPKNINNSTVLQSNVITTIEPSATVTVDNESCKVKLTKTVSNNWRVLGAPNLEENESNDDNNNYNREHDSIEKVELDFADARTECNVNDNSTSLYDKMTKKNNQIGENIMVYINSGINNKISEIETIPEITNVRSLIKFEDSEPQNTSFGQTGPRIGTCDTLKSSDTELDEFKIEETEIDISDSVNTEAENNVVDIKDAKPDYHSEDSQATLLLVADDDVLNNETLNEININVERDINTSYTAEADVRPKAINNTSIFEKDKQLSKIETSNFSVGNDVINLNQTKISDHFSSSRHFIKEPKTAEGTTPLEKGNLEKDIVVSISDDETEKCDSNMAIEISDDEDILST